MKKNFIYLDHAATTQIDPSVLKAMMSYFTNEYGNASAIYQLGRSAKQALGEARKSTARILGAKEREIYFTSGGTEGDNLAILGYVRANQLSGKKTKGHIITTNIEHHAVLDACRALEKEGFRVSYLPADKDGLISVRQIENAVCEDTILVTIIYANNEIGTILPIAQIGKKLKQINPQRETMGLPRIAFHTDACQAACFLNLKVNELNIDMLTINGSKIYGPKGVGALYVRSGLTLWPLVYGGGQEKNLRSGTENIAGIVGFFKALEIANKLRRKESDRLIELRDYFIGRLLREIPKTVLNGHPTKRLPNNINVSILDIEGEAAVLYLDAKGIACSTGSACTASDLNPSHVILALGRSYEHAHGSLRFTLGRKTAKRDIDSVMKVLPVIIKKLRKMSPVNLKIRK